jgi:Uma2 family endonuclease
MKPPRTRPAPLVPTLENGDRMNQPEFHLRYEAYPQGVKIELVGGTVYVASPMRWPHGELTWKLVTALDVFVEATPGVLGADGVSAILSEESEPQPDLLLRLLPEYGGQARLDEQRYLVGAPEFIAEVAHSTRAMDLNQKRKDYLEAGVQEYLVVCVEEEEFHWFHFPSRRKLKADREGLWKSRIFPGLWIDQAALFARDSGRLRAAMQRGIASPEHAAFVRTLQSRRTKDRHAR